MLSLKDRLLQKDQMTSDLLNDEKSWIKYVKRQHWRPYRLERVIDFQWSEDEQSSLSVYEKKYKALVEKYLHTVRLVWIDGAFSSHLSQGLGKVQIDLEPSIDIELDDRCLRETDKKSMVDFFWLPEMAIEGQSFIFKGDDLDVACIHIGSESGRSSFSSLNFVFSEHSSCKIDEVFHFDSESDALFMQKRRFKVGEGASVRFDHLSTGKTLGSLMLKTEIELSKYAVFSDHAYCASGQINHQERWVMLNGTQSNYDFKGGSIAFADQVCGHSVYVFHNVPQAFSSQLHKSVIESQGVCDYMGYVHVQKGAGKTYSDQANHHLILDQGGQGFSRPELEIYDDDVICKHGSTLGFLSEDLIWYLGTRGLNVDEARSVLVQAHLGVVSDEVSMVQKMWQSVVHSYL